MNAGCAGETVRSLENACLPERLTGVFTMRRSTNSRLPYLYLTFTFTCDDADINECATDNGGCSDDACLPGYYGYGVGCSGKSATLLVTNILTH